MFTKISGFTLIIIGLVMIVYAGINIVRQEKIADIGPVEVSLEKNNSVKWPSILGTVFLVGGVLIFILDKKETHED
jgi:hypothetical protein